MKYKIGDIVKSIRYSGQYKIIATRELGDTQFTPFPVYPPSGCDYSLRRLDGVMEFTPDVHDIEANIELIEN